MGPCLSRRPGWIGISMLMMHCVWNKRRGRIWFDQSSRLINKKPGEGLAALCENCSRKITYTRRTQTPTSNYYFTTPGKCSPLFRVPSPLPEAFDPSILLLVAHYNIPPTHFAYLPYLEDNEGVVDSWIFVTTAMDETNQALGWC